MKLLAMTVMSLSLLALGFVHVGQTQAPSGDRTQPVEIMRNGV